MSIKHTPKTTAAWTLPEMMLAVGVFSICGLALASLFIFGTRSFAALSNYAVLDQANRQAMDQLTYEIRQATQVTSYSPNPPTLTLVNGDGQTVTYQFNPTTKRMVRSAGGVSQILLDNCNLLNFNLYQRNPSNANYGIFPLATSNYMKTVKVVELTWKTSLTISPTTRVNSENIQTARIVIRKQQD